MLREFPWRSGTNSTDHWVACDTGSSSAVNFVALANPVIIGMSGTLKLQGSNDGAAWTDIVTIPHLTTPRTRVWVAYFNTVSYRHFRVFLQRTTGTGYLEIAVVRVGTYFQPTYDPDLPLNLQRHDSSRLTKGSSGNINRSQQNHYSTFDLNFVSMPQSDVDQFDLMYDMVGIGNPFFITIDPSNLEETWLAFFTTPIQKDPVVANDWNIRLSVEEAL
jgi:hypothetical protein